MSNRFALHHGDCLEVLASISDCSIDSVVCDPPYGLSFMGRKWDCDVPSEAIWRECLRVLKPGGHLLAFAGTRTQHRMAVRIEDAGFEIRDMIAWVYSTGFPKSLDVSKAIEARALTGGSGPKNIRMRDMGDNYRPHDLAGTEGYGDGRMSRGADTDRDYRSAPKVTTPEARQWQGWGTALKPALEPITVARKPLIGTVAANVLKHGTGALNIDGCRVEHVTIEGGNLALNPHLRSHINGGNGGNIIAHETERRVVTPHADGRWPANLIHDGSDNVVEMFPQSKSTGGQSSLGAFRNGDVYGKGKDERWIDDPGYGDSGSAARFFYCAKASKKDRNEGCEELDRKISARSCQAQAEAKRGNVVECEGGAFNKARLVQNNHPTVKPTDLMRYLCRLVTPPGGLILDPFMGSGSTGKAAMIEGFRFIGIEREAEYLEIAQARVAHAVGKTNNMLAFE